MQQAARPFVWVFVVSILLILAFIVKVWVDKLPVVPSLGATLEEISTYSCRRQAIALRLRVFRVNPVVSRAVKAKAATVDGSGVGVAK